MNEHYWVFSELIDDYDLHRSGAPVNLSPLEDICPLYIDDLTRMGVVGFCYATEPASRRTPATIAVCRSLNREQRRLTYAHEVAHGVYGHSGAMELADIFPWLEVKQEREAWIGAAMLLIPRSSLYYGNDISIESIARECRIPTWLVELHPDLR